MSKVKSSTNQTGKQVLSEYDNTSSLQKSELISKVVKKSDSKGYSRYNRMIVHEQ